VNRARPVQSAFVAVLDEILATKRDEVTRLHRPGVRELLCRRALEAEPPRDFAGALRRSGGLAVIAEIKRRSPSKGDLAPDLDAAATAKSYEAGGAACLSVLTDGPYFSGSADDLHVARNATGVPVLRKDFTIDEIQVFETRALGADALLLIAAALPDDSVFADLHALAGELGLAVLVETHDAAELERALSIGAEIVGVNARDLDTFEEDLGVGEGMVRHIPSGIVAVAESAIRGVDDGRRMAAAGFDAVLVGELLVRSDDPAATVAGLTTIARRPR
jgi:indole-3-glycerol phosphate synthase